MVSDNVQRNKPATATPEHAKEGDGHAPGSQPGKVDQATAGDKTAGQAKTTTEKSLITELLEDGKEVLNLFRRAFGISDSKPATPKPAPEKTPAEKPAGEKSATDKPAENKAPENKAAENKTPDKKPEPEAQSFTQLPDGTRITKDGSIEFSAATQSARDAKKDVVHKWTDKQGSHSLEIRDGVVYLDDYKVSEDKIIKRSGDRTTVIDKQTHDIQVNDNGDQFRQNETLGGAVERHFQQRGQTYGFRQSNGQWSIVDSQNGGQLGDVSSQGVTLGTGDDRITLLARGRSARQRNGLPMGLRVDEEGNLSAEMKDGTHLSFIANQGEDKKGFVLSLKRDGIELQMSLDGKHARIRRGDDGPWEDVPEEDIPKEFKNKIVNGVVQLDGRRRFDMRNRQVYTEDSEHGRHVDWEGRRPGILHVRGCPQVVLRDGQFELVDPKNPDASPIIWDPEKRQFKTRMGVFSEDQVKFSNGDEVYSNGEVRFYNQNGTFDRVDRAGNLDTAGGTRVGADMTVHTSDGRSFSASSTKEGDASVVGSPANAASVADRASAVASAVQGKAVVDFDDVAKLADSQGDISMLIANCMARGDLNSVALLMAAQARVDGALSFALSRAQACTIAHQMGVFSASLIQEMQDNIYGKTPLYAVQSGLEARAT